MIFVNRHQAREHHVSDKAQHECEANRLWTSNQTRSERSGEDLNRHCRVCGPWNCWKRTSWLLHWHVGGRSSRLRSVSTYIFTSLSQILVEKRWLCIGQCGQGWEIMGKFVSAGISVLKLAATVHIMLLSTSKIKFKYEYILVHTVEWRIENCFGLTFSRPKFDSMGHDNNAFIDCNSHSLEV